MLAKSILDMIFFVQNTPNIEILPNYKKSAYMVKLDIRPKLRVWIDLKIDLQGSKIQLVKCRATVGSGLIKVRIFVSGRSYALSLYMPETFCCFNVKDVKEILPVLVIH